MNQKEIMRRYLGNPRQLAGIRRFVVDDDRARGMRVFEVNNGSGLIFNVYPDRGMDIGEVFFNGRQLAWLTGSSAASPAFYSTGGNEWLRTWGGGLLTGCGYLNVGPAEGNEGLHGRLSHIPAGEVNSFADYIDDSTFKLEVSGKVSHAKVFSENLLLKRTISTINGRNTIVIEDRIENLGFKTVPFMMLNHMNFGWPLIDENCRLESSSSCHEVIARNPRAAEGIDKWHIMEEPQPGFVEQVYFHQGEKADADGMASMAIINKPAGLKVTVRRRLAELPLLTQWKQMGAGNYVLGLEPSNCKTDGVTAAEKAGELKYLQPQEVVNTRIEVCFETI